MAGYAGKILKVDLDREEIITEIMPGGLLEKFIGGAGLGAYLLYKLVPPEVKADSPKNWVILSTGPLTGTIIPFSGRLSITTVSPVTGIFADTNCGGDFGPELKFAGYDQVLITGKAKRPVYLWINDDEVELRDARHLVGKTTWDADELLRNELGNWRIKTALVGPAAQKGVLFGALIINKYRACAKTGIGSALAQKNMIGIAVHGRKGISVYDPAGFEEACEKILSTLRSAEGFQSYSKTGTLALVDLYQEIGRLAVKNRQETGVPNELFKNISCDNFMRNFKLRDRACYNCPLHCSNWFKIEKGPYAGEEGEKPELVTVMAFGPTLANYDLGAICHFQNECNRYGIDIMECANTLALAFEAYQRGLITMKETDGIALEWGNLDSIQKIFNKIANFEGFGKILGLGVKRTSEWIGKGADKFTYMIKGAGMGLFEVRNAPQWGLAYSTATRGSDHLKALPYFMTKDPEMIKGLPFADDKPEELFSEFDFKGKGKMVAWFENYMAVLDSLILCKLGYKVGWIHPKELASALSLATGISYDLNKLIECGERIYHVEKAFNARLGLCRKDDILPQQFLENPVKAGPRKGQHLGSIFPQMLDEYYEARGWEKETGLPPKGKFESLGLDEIANELETNGRPTKA